MVASFSLISAGAVYFSVCMTVFGIAYAYWVIARTSLTADVAESSLSETRVAAIANLTFIIPIVLASYAGSKLYELYGVAGLSILLLPIGLYAWKYRAVTPIDVSEKILPRELFGALRASWKYVLAIGLLWAISTAASQLIIQVLAGQFNLPTSSATLVLLASSIGVIIGSVIMAKMPKSAVHLTNLISIVLLILLFIILPFAIGWLRISQFVAPLYGIAFGIGVIFACSVSAIEGVFYRRLATLRIQTLGGVLYGIGVSVVNVVLMFSLDIFNSSYGFANGFFLLALGMLAIGMLFGRERT